MSTTNVSAVAAAGAPHRASTAPPTERLPRSSAMLAELLRGAPSTKTESTSTPCPLFPTESEDYYCLSCHARCSGLALLVGPHTNHDYLPLKDALLYMPAALLRETQEVVRESEEAFAKPWRGQEQQREDTLHYLLTQRRSKLAAIAQLMEDVRGVDAQLWRVTEAKAVDLGNWRYQQRALRRKMEKLHGGADALSASLRAAPSNSAVAQSDPSWLHRQAVAQEELVQVRHLLGRQLEQLAEDEAAAAHHLATWRRLLDAVPSGSDVNVGGATSATPTAATATATLVNSSSAWEREVRRPVGATAGNDKMDHPHDATTAPRRPPSPQLAPATPEPTTILAHPPDAPSPHPSDAEVVLLQHALLNIHDGLRRRLLRAAAASLSSSSSSQSRLPSTSGEGATQGTVGVAETVASTLPPLPGETPLRDVTGRLHRDAATAEVISPPPRSSAHATAMDMVKTPVSTAAWPTLARRERDEDKEARSARWQSLQAQDRALKESLNQLLEETTGPALRHVHPAAAAASSSSASSFTPGLCAGEYATVSAVSGPLSSNPALQSYAIDY